MSKTMLIDATHPEETRVAVVDGRKLEEFDVEIAGRRPLKGNIYLAKVTRVEPSLQACFVEYGGNRHGFLAFNEIHPDYYQIPHADREALMREIDDEDDDDHRPSHGAANVEGGEDDDAESMGALLNGNNITFRDNTISHPVNVGDDTDGLHFFGNNISIVHNTIKDVYDGSHCDQNGCGDGPHPDCMQTFYSDQYPTSSDVTIEGNRCEDIAAQCLIGEGPVIPGENINGPGQSIGWTFYDNYCDAGAAQSVQLKDIKNATIVGNAFKGSNNKAIALSDGSTGAHVGGNKVSSNIGKLITFDDGQEAPGYIGPTPDK